MAEIKSTLDLIMERTKGLELSAAEKAEIRLREATGTVRGWLQKFRDGLLSPDALRSLYTEALNRSPEVRDVMKAALMDRITLDDDGGEAVALCEALLDIPPAPLHELRLSFLNRLKCAEDTAKHSARTRLAERGISGDAAVPNPAAAPGWTEARTAIEADFLRARRTLADTL